MNKKINIVVTPTRVIVVTDRPGKDDKIILSHEQIMKRLPETVCTEPVIAASVDLCLATIQALMAVEFPVQLTGKLFFQIDGTSVSKQAKKVSGAELKQFILKPISEITGLQTRHFNCLKAAEIKTIFELLTYSDNELLKYRNFGQNGIVSVRSLLTESGITDDIRAKMISIEKEVRNAFEKKKIADIENLKNFEAIKDLKKLLGNFKIEKEVLKRFNEHDIFGMSKEFLPKLTNKSEESKMRGSLNEFSREVSRYYRKYRHDEMLKIVEQMNF